MCSRGSIIPLFISQIKSGQPLTVTEPNMTRFMMSLDDSVRLVMYAFKHAHPGDIFVQKAPAATVETLAIADVYKRQPYGEEFFTETTKYDPHSPYSASKASSDHFVRAFHDTYGMPTLVTNCSNNYGPVSYTHLDVYKRQAYVGVPAWSKTTFTRGVWAVSRSMVLTKLFPNSE